MSSLELTAHKAYTAHRAAFADGWTEGSITETWMDEDHHLCVRYVLQELADMVDKRRAELLDRQ